MQTMIQTASYISKSRITSDHSELMLLAVACLTLCLLSVALALRLPDIAEAVAILS